MLMMSTFNHGFVTTSFILAKINNALLLHYNFDLVLT